ncbi:MAG TPA: glycoside hydrolase family 3 C-terminal domain-containing protein, partial [Limnochordia bacterium]
ALRNAVQQGQIPMETIDRAVARILRVKETLGLEQNTPPTPEAAQRTVTRPDHWELARQVAAAAVTLVRDEKGWIPLSAGDSLLVIEPEVAALTPVESRPEGPAGLAGALHRHFPALTARTMKLDPTDAQRAALLAAARSAQTVIVATYRAWAHPAQAQLVRELLASGRRVIVISLREPYDLAQFPEAPAYVAAYSSTGAALLAAADLLAGTIQPQGHLPVRIPGLYPVGHGISR